MTDLAEFDKPSLKSILAIKRSISEGTFRSDPDSIRLCHALQHDSFSADLKTFCGRASAKFDEPRQIEVLRQLSFSHGLAELRAVRPVFAGHKSIAERLDIYLALHGDPDAIIRELRRAFDREDAMVLKRRAIELALGFLYSSPSSGSTMPLDVIAGAGQLCLRGLAEQATTAEAAFFAGLAATTVGETGDPPAPAPATPTGEASVPGVMVVPPYAAPSTLNKNDRQRTRSDFHLISGKTLPLVPTGDVVAHLTTLSNRAPHLQEIYDAMLTDTAMSPHAAFRPTIFVGDPGAGKSWSAKQLARVMGVPVTLYGCGGAADATFGGTSAQWSTSGASVPLQFVLQSRVANPIVVLDEIEKVGSGSHNGRLLDVLLPFLERSDAETLRDPALEMAVDLSCVSYVMTANSLVGIPAPFLDRCRIIRVPTAKREHLPFLIAGVIDDIANNQKLNPRWYPPLAPDEVAVIGEVWSGGSFRELRRIVERFIINRHRLTGVC